MSRVDINVAYPTALTRRIRVDDVRQFAFRFKMDDRGYLPDLHAIDLVEVLVSATTILRGGLAF